MVATAQPAGRSSGGDGPSPGDPRRRGRWLLAALRGEAARGRAGSRELGGGAKRGGRRDERGGEEGVL